MYFAKMSQDLKTSVTGALSSSKKQSFYKVDKSLQIVISQKGVMYLPVRIIKKYVTEAYKN